MKFVFLLGFACIFGISQAYWSNCPGGIPGFDTFESPQCSGDRCRAVRGEVFYVELSYYVSGAYEELRVRATALIFGVGKLQ